MAWTLGACVVLVAPATARGGAPSAHDNARGRTGRRRGPGGADGGGHAGGRAGGARRRPGWRAGRRGRRRPGGRSGRARGGQRGRAGGRCADAHRGADAARGARADRGPVGVGVPGQSWVEGHYDWLNGQYRWIPGAFGKDPRSRGGAGTARVAGQPVDAGLLARAHRRRPARLLEAARGAWNPGGLLGAPPTQTVIVSPNGVLQGVQQVVPLMR